MLPRTMLALGVALSIALCCEGRAQKSGVAPVQPLELPARPEPGNWPNRLLKFAEVRQELKLTRRQEAQLQEIGAEIEADGMALLNLPADLSEEQREAEWDKLFSKHPMYRQREKEVYTAQQYARRQQIIAQGAASAGLLSEELVEELGLDDDQEKRMRSLTLDTREKFGVLAKQGVFNDAERAAELEKVRAIMAEGRAQATVILTEEQRAKLEQLQGEPLKLEWALFFEDY